MDEDIILFDDLVRCVADASASEEELRTLANMMRRDSRFAKRYARQMHVHALLTCQRGQEWPEAKPSLAEEAASDVGTQPAVGLWRGVAAAAAAVIVGVTMWLAWPLGRGARFEKDSVVTVVSSLHGQWADGRGVVAGTALKAGVWVWQGGLVELVTRDGTVLLVEAPANLEIINALYARLHAGKLVVRMPKGQSGFVVETPEVKVFDLGTEFGVSVSPGAGSHVQVFNGKVRTETANATLRKELHAGETVRADEAGGLVVAAYDEKMFIRRFPPVPNPERPSGFLYSRSEVEAVRVAVAEQPVKVDGDLSEWDRRVAFKSACAAQYAGDYWIEGLMMYDATNLYLAAHVGDPDPMRNTAPEGFEFAGGSVIVRVSTDPALGWPLKGTLVEGGTENYRKNPLTPDAASEGITSLVMWHDAGSGRAKLKIERGIDQHGPTIDPPGWRGAFRKDADGCGYTLEYAISWKLLKCAERPPQAGDELAALWMVHWSDAEGRIARGQLVEVTNHQPHQGQELPPYCYFQNGPSWGKAIYLPKGE